MLVRMIVYGCNFTNIYVIVSKIKEGGKIRKGGGGGTSMILILMVNNKTI